MPVGTGPSGRRQRRGGRSGVGAGSTAIRAGRSPSSARRRSAEPTPAIVWTASHAVATATRWPPVAAAAPAPIDAREIAQPTATTSRKRPIARQVAK